MATTTKPARAPRIPADYKPITMWGYFGYQVLFSVPIIGWVFLVVFALTAPNINLRNFARSQFCLLIIYVVLASVLCVTGIFAAGLEALLR